LQYSFTHSLVERPFNGWLKPGRHAINLVGGAPAWTTMQATLASSDYRLHLDAGGNTFDHFTVQCGPVEHLEPGQLVQLFNTFANRDLARIDTGERLTGVPAPNSTILMPADTAQENTVTGIPDQAFQVFSAPDASNPGTTVAITHHPAAGQITVAQLDSTSGAPLNQRLVMAEYSGAGAPGPATLA
jgi:hypothetical protein